ncbi:MAG: hypothetical protein B7Y99_09605 [Caulobacterales bacterium 32-69-10]|nr:MAG: hypothetical protein B7Y99_09605 [Caulobacterales bacterium 32-69-10]
MNRTILIAGLVAVVTAGAALAQAPPAPPAPAGQDKGPGFHGGRGFHGGQGGPGGRRFMRQPPTAEQVQQRNAALVTRMDANRDGRVTFEEFRTDAERQRLERQRRMFERFSGEKDSFTLDQLNARSLERLNDRKDRQERGGRRGPGRGPGGQTPPAPPAAR